MHIVFKQKSTENNAYWDGFLSVLKNYPNNGLFLEIGAANMEQTKAHRKIFNRLIGLDLNFTRLPKSSGFKMINGDAQSLPFKNNVFDGIISHHVIEHVEKDGILINEIQRILKKGGFAIIGTPNRKRLVRVLVEIFTGERKFPWWEHQREYVKHELLELAGKRGFSDVFVYSKFLGVHTYRIILGFSRYPRIFEKWCSFLFLVLVK